jgi:hypothetical protein
LSVDSRQNDSFKIFQTSEETDELIVQKAIEMWNADGSFLLPPIDINLAMANLAQHRDLHQIMSNHRPPFLAVPKLPLVANIVINTSGSEIIEEEN